MVLSGMEFIYLTNRKQFLYIDGIKSNLLNITYLFSLVSILGPKFFLLYASMIFAMFHKYFILYADDVFFRHEMLIVCEVLLATNWLILIACFEEIVTHCFQNMFFLQQ